MDADLSLKLTSKYPCCGGICRFVAIRIVPKETYSKKCPRCGSKWLIERKTTRQTEELRMDTLEWTDETNKIRYR